MENLKTILSKEGFKSVKFKITKTQHMFVRAKINGVWGDFILDSGASNTCIDFQWLHYFGLSAVDSKTKASGAGANNLFTQVSHANNLQLGRYKLNNVSFVLLDLSHVNTALTEHRTKNVHGIIGAEVLLMTNAIIDYGSCTLFLSK